MADIQYKYDVFLSHNSKDKPAVENIARLLRDEYNQKTWLDKWNLVPGEAGQEALEQALDESRTFAVFLGLSGIGPWENEEMRSAIEDRIKDPNRRVIPVLLPGAPDSKDLKLPRFLRRTTWVDFRSGLEDQDALYQLYCGITGQAPGDRGSSKPDTGTPSTWNLKHPYPMPPNFTGRIAERTMLSRWLNDDKENRLFILRALGGFGKSALAWHWLTNDIDTKEWTKVLWWDFYQGDGSFENFIKEALEYLKIPVPDNQRAQVDELLKAMQAQKVLFIMDGFERLLRAYSSMNAAHQGDEGKKREDRDGDCVNNHAEHFLKSLSAMPALKSKALMTTRLTPRVLIKFDQFIKGCHEQELKAIDKDDAVAFFRAQGVHKGTDHEIEAACESYGFHPLSLRLLAGYIMADFKNAGDIIVAKQLKISGDIAEHQNHILEVSYKTLIPNQQKLLSTIACFRSSTKLEILESIAKNAGAIGESSLQDDLHGLIERGLLQYDKTNQVFDLHPIVRRFAYEQFLDKDRKNTHIQLAMHFVGAMPVTNKNVKTLEDLAPVIELYHHMVRAGNLDEAFKLYYDRLQKAIYYQFGAYQLQIELLRALFLDSEDKPPRLKREGAQSYVLTTLGAAYNLTGQPRQSIVAEHLSKEIDEKRGEKEGVAISLENLGIRQLPIGALSAAERDLRRSIDLCREISGEFWEGVGHQSLGNLLSYCGIWQEAEQELSAGLKLFEKQNAVQSESVIWLYRSLRFLLMSRDNPQVSSENLKSSIECAQRALKLADEQAKDIPIPRDYVSAYWLLGAAYRTVLTAKRSTNDELTLAEENLSKALNLCRQINSVDTEANILLEIAKLRYTQGDFKDAQEKASEALMITERSGYVLTGADVNLFLAQYALEQEKDKVKAKVYAEEAKKLATCDGPPYYYKVAYEEAERLLASLNV